jgi:hypothetical protein
MAFLSLRDRGLPQGLVSYGLVGLLACQQQPASVAPPSRIFRRGQQLTYQVVHRATPSATARLDTLTLWCYGKYKPEDHYGAVSPEQAGDTLQSKVGFSYTAHALPANFAGVIEDDSTLWSHPPREGAYRVLELSPYPFLKFPLRAGKRWTDSLDVGAWYGHPAWGEWQGDMRVTSTYIVQGQRALRTPFGVLRCWVVQARATCQKGTSRLVIWYHPQYGLVRLNYATIHHQILDLGLVHVATIHLPEAKAKGLPDFMNPL